MPGERHHELPAQPSLEWYRKQAKALAREFRSDVEEAVTRSEEVLGARAHERFALADAQHVIAQEHGFATWAEFKHDVESRTEPDRPVGRIGIETAEHYDRRALELIEEARRMDEHAVRRVRAHLPRLAALADAELGAVLEERDARIVVAREYGFRTWRELVHSAETFNESWHEHRVAKGTVAEAIDAIRRGDAGRLRALLDGDQTLTTRTAVRGETLLGALTQPDVFGQGLGRELGVDRDCAQILIEASYDLDVPLNIASCFGRLELMELLLAAGADPLANEIWGISALVTAIYHGQAEAADLLVPYGLVPDTLWLAAGAGLLDRVEAWFNEAGRLRPGAGEPHPNLADVGWPPDAPPLDDEATVLGEALTMACYNGRTAVVDCLLDHGADIDVRPWMAMTGLHFAVVGDKLDTARFLVERGADLGLRDRIHGGTPLGWAAHPEVNRPEIAALLRSRGAPE